MPDPAKDVFRLFNEIGIIAQLSGSLFNKRLPEGLHVAHFSVLNHMVRLGDGKTPHRLASAFQVTRATMTHTIGELAKRGFVHTQPNPADGRSKLVFLTEEGRAFQQRAVASLAPLLPLIINEPAFANTDKLLPELTRIREWLDANRGL